MEKGRKGRRKRGKSSARYHVTETGIETPLRHVPEVWYTKYMRGNRYVQAEMRNKNVDIQRSYSIPRTPKQTRDTGLLHRAGGKRRFPLDPSASSSLSYQHPLTTGLTCIGHIHLSLSLDSSLSGRGALSLQKKYRGFGRCAGNGKPFVK
jgi:hypothetical protein